MIVIGVVFLADFLNIEQDGKSFKVPVLVVKDVKSIKPVLSDTGWKIVSLLAEKAMYPAEIAKKLGLHEQKIYYYVNQLKKTGLIAVKKTEEKQGALAKYYAVNFDSIALVPNLKGAIERKDFEFSNGMENEMGKQLKEFFSPFIHNGRLSAKIVIGSPDPHGPLKARARDAHLAVELAAFLGSLAKGFKYPFVLLDTMVPALEELDENIIIIGGPITNKLCNQLHKHLPIVFKPNGGHYLVHSTLSGRDYNEDAIGVIEKIVHPFFEGRKILLVAGNRNAGTKAAIIALIKNIEDIVRGNEFSDGVDAKVVEGLDMDGDGEIDNVEIRE